MVSSEMLTMKKYHLQCRIHVVKVQGQTITKDGRAPKNIEADCVCLIPLQSTEMETFLAAWLPLDSSETFEIPTFMPHPINSPCRVKISRKNHMCEEHHLFVMSHGCEQELIQVGHGKIVPVVVLPEDQEDILDSAK